MLTRARKAWLLIGVVLLPVVAALGLGAAGFRLGQQKGAAMTPTIETDEYFVMRIGEAERERLQRFDLVVYHLNSVDEQRFLARVIGFGGERVTIGDGVRVNGEPLTLPPTVDREGLTWMPRDVVVPSDAIYVIGDNTARALDSRSFGPLWKINVVGRVMFIR